MFLIIRLFFFDCDAAPRVLHSFPTRRSSDLDHRRRGGRADVGHGERPRQRLGPVPIELRQLLPERLPARLLLALDLGVDLVVLRSEEHTSELQSRFDLVCRLLLEKKKKNNQDDSQLNQMRSTLTTEAAYFVRTLRTE